ncbi:hypothetical protein B0H13DRAFT_1660199, partial [Mycena leptocephala]
EGLHILHRAIAGDAFHDSAERYPPPRCHPEVRTKLLGVLRNWANGINPPTNWTKGILWLYGPAGAGKSAVAQSFCQQLKDEGRLGGSFFFKRDHSSRGNAKKLFPTITYQLALTLPALKKHISQSVENDPAIVDMSLSDQLQNLIIKPCRKSFLPRPLSIIIGGLDECDGEDIQPEILDSIGKLSILFFIASRPEAHIREAFSDTALDGFHRPMNIDQSFDDVRKYVVDQFARIHAAHRTTMSAVPSPWPSSEIVEALLKTSSGYFIYASTVVKFVDDKRFRPVDCLNIILGVKNSLCASPFDTLDQLYLQVLCDVPIDFRPQLLEILLVIVEPTFSFCVWQIEELLGLETGDVHLIMRGLHSVINVPEEHNVALTVHHASFTDFLNHLSRSGPFYVGGSQYRKNVTHHLFKAFSRPIDDLRVGWTRQFELHRSRSVRIYCFHRAIHRLSTTYTVPKHGFPLCFRSVIDHACC